MKHAPTPPEVLRQQRNAKLYRSLMRVFRVYQRNLVEQLRARGFGDFSPAFPQILSNLDTGGTRVGVLAERAGITRQGAGQLLAELERCGYVRRSSSKTDARATLVRFTARGRKLLATVLSLVDETERSYAKLVGAERFAALQRDLLRIADAIDPIGALGSDDSF